MRMHRKHLMILGLAGCLLALGCAGPHAYMTRSQGVSQQFETGDLPTGLRYYYHGSPYMPDALLGLEAEYLPDGAHWKPAPREAAALRSLAISMRYHDPQGNTHWARGAGIHLPDGRRIGVWYSSIGLGLVKVGEENRVHVWPPERREPPEHVKRWVRGR